MVKQQQHVSPRATVRHRSRLPLSDRYNLTCKLQTQQSVEPARQRSRLIFSRCSPSSFLPPTTQATALTSTTVQSTAMATASTQPMTSALAPNHATGGAVNTLPAQNGIVDPPMGPEIRRQVSLPVQVTTTCVTPLNCVRLSSTSAMRIFPPTSISFDVAKVARMSLCQSTSSAASAR
jgi:hypothetical protein